MSKKQYPPGWNETRVRRVIQYYDSQTEDEEAAEIERALIADADNPDAWEGPIIVTPNDAPRPDWYGRTRRIAGSRKVARPRKGTIRNVTRKK